MHALGIDIGGSGIKAAPVDVTTGKLLADRQKVDTPRPALPESVSEVVKKLTGAFSWTRPGSGWTPPPCSARPPASRSGC
jgi:polyphosphate glucokinase